jgi:hypothetical protein
VFWVISVYFNIRNTLPKFCPFLLGHPVYLLPIWAFVVCSRENMGKILAMEF